VGSTHGSTANRVAEEIRRIAAERRDFNEDPRSMNALLPFKGWRRKLLATHKYNKEAVELTIGLCEFFA
jgi:hypothetical protein